MTPEQLTAAVVAGEMSHRDAYFEFARRYGRKLDASALVVPCEGCGTPTPWTEIVSYKLWLPHAGHPQVEGFELDVYDSCNGQHYCCSHDCAAKQVMTCLHEHHEPERHQRVTAAKTRTHAIAVAATAETAGEVAAAQPKRRRAK